MENDDKTERLQIRNEEEQKRRSQAMEDRFSTFRDDKCNWRNPINLTEMEMPFMMMEMHEQLANQLEFVTFAEYVAFVLRDYARYLLKENPRRLGELIGQAMQKGNCIQDCDLTGD